MSEALTVSDALSVMINGGQDIPARRKELKRQFEVMSEMQLKLLVKEHIVTLWGSRMITAIPKGYASVTNRWSGRRYFDDRYIFCLQELLGPRFKVERKRSFRSGLYYVEVSWE